MIERNSDVSRIVDRLVKTGWVEKIECPHDKRSTWVKITESGLAKIVEVGDAVDRTETITVRLTEDEARELNRLLDKIRD
jgi:DNA-binding MarR family transcriptional regulator